MRKKRKLGIVIFSLVVLIASVVFVLTYFATDTTDTVQHYFGEPPSLATDTTDTIRHYFGKPSLDMAYVEPLPSNPSLLFVNNRVEAWANRGVSIEQVSATAESVGGRIAGRINVGLGTCRHGLVR